MTDKAEKLREEDERCCPFCGDDEYDAIGLKEHLTRGRCKAFNETPDYAMRTKPQAEDVVGEEKLVNTSMGCLRCGSMFNGMHYQGCPDAKPTAPDDVSGEEIVRCDWEDIDCPHPHRCSHSSPHKENENCHTCSRGTGCKPIAQDEGEKVEYEVEKCTLCDCSTRIYAPLCSKCRGETAPSYADLQAKLAETEKRFPTLTRTVNGASESYPADVLVKLQDLEITDLQAKLAEWQTAAREEAKAADDARKELADYKDATNISPAVIEEWTKENAEDKKRIEELEAEARQRSNEEARDIRREVEYDNGMKQRPCCARLEAKLKATEEVVEAGKRLIKYRCRAGNMGFQLEKADDFIWSMKAALSNLDEPEQEPEEKHFSED